MRRSRNFQAKSKRLYVNLENTLEKFRAPRLVNVGD